MKEFVGCSYEIKGMDERGEVQFYANVFHNLDSDRDISLPGSFAKTLKENSKRLRHFKYHDSRLMPGVIREAKEDETGLLITSQLILNTQLGRETYEEYKAMYDAGKQMEHSVGVNAIKYERDEENECRKVAEWKLWEVSTLTAWGANDRALAISVKELHNASREEIEREIIFLKGLLNVSTYNDLKLEQIDKQINFLNSLKAGVQPELEATTAKATLEEWKRVLKLN